MSAETPTKIKLSEGETELLTKALLQAREEAKTAPASRGEFVPLPPPRQKPKPIVKKQRGTSII
jgi:hypothetical protein